MPWLGAQRLAEARLRIYNVKHKMAHSRDLSFKYYCQCIFDDSFFLSGFKSVFEWEALQT